MGAWVLDQTWHAPVAAAMMGAHRPRNGLIVADPVMIVRGNGMGDGGWAWLGFKFLGLAVLNP